MNDVIIGNINERFDYRITLITPTDPEFLFLKKFQSIPKERSISTYNQLQHMFSQIPTPKYMLAVGEWSNNSLRSIGECVQLSQLINLKPGFKQGMTDISKLDVVDQFIDIMNSKPETTELKVVSKNITYPSSYISVLESVQHLTKAGINVERDYLSNSVSSCMILKRENGRFTTSSVNDMLSPFNLSAQDHLNSVLNIDNWEHTLGKFLMPKVIRRLKNQVAYKCDNASEIAEVRFSETVYAAYCELGDSHEIKEQKTFNFFSIPGSVARRP